MTLRVVIVDDEEIARRAMRTRLEREGVVVVGECANGAEALDIIPKVTPDLAFLDIQMPEMSGLETVSALGPLRCPQVIFVTAFDQYAIKAFELNALDYLVKPLDEERLRAALARARDALRVSQESDLGRRAAKALFDMRALANPLANGLGLDRILVRTGGRIVVVRISEIDWVEASGDYVSLHVNKNAWLVRETIGAFAQQYGSYGLLRIHRSTLVNVDKITELRPLDNGEFTVVLQDGKELRLSRSYRDILDALLGRAT
jgi:two-component system, LytTR family, response regulator